MSVHGLRLIHYLVGLCVFITTPSVAQVWTQSPVTGNWYALTPTGTWAAVQDVAQQWGGELVAISSAEEQSWVQAHLATNTKALATWIGLFQDINDPNYAEPAGAWKWTTGEPLSFTNWAPSEPNNFGGGEAHAQAYVPSGLWNDDQPLDTFPGLTELVSADCDADLVPDAYEIVVGLEPDLNGNGIPDGCDIDPWADLGDGLAGAVGVPQLAGAGTLLGGEPATVALTGAIPFAPTILVIGVENRNAAFKGGVLVPSADVLFALTTDGFGSQTFGGPWPAAVPSGTQVYFQEWIVDVGGPKGFAASNGLSGTTP